MEHFNVTLYSKCWSQMKALEVVIKKTRITLKYFELWRKHWTKIFIKCKREKAFQSEEYHEKEKKYWFWLGCFCRWTKNTSSFPSIVWLREVNKRFRDSLTFKATFLLESKLLKFQSFFFDGWETIRNKNRNKDSRTISTHDDRISIFRRLLVECLVVAGWNVCNLQCCRLWSPTFHTS